MAKIAVELEQAVALRATKGEPGRTNSRVLAQGDAWHVADVLCTCGPQDQPFEEQHPNVTIAVVVAGTFQYAGSENHSGVALELMSPGSLLLGNAGQHFECSHDHGFGDRCLSFRYAPDYFERLAADAGLSPGQRQFRMLRLPPLKPLSRTVARAYTALACGTASSASWEELSVGIAAEVVKLANGSSGRASGPPPSTLARVTRVVRWIERERHAELSLEALAQMAGLSPYHFLRTFRQMTGLTPHQYVLRLRLREAAMRLASESGKVLNIALDCGFGDVSNFNRAFRSEFGVSPRAYRLRSSARLAPPSESSFTLPMA